MNFSANSKHRFVYVMIFRNSLIMIFTLYMLTDHIFWILMIIATVFNLKIYQWDAVNTFMNNKIKKTVYCDYLKKFDRFEMCLFVMRLIELKKIMWHVEHVEHKRSKSWECMMLVLSMLSMMCVKHVEHDTLRMYWEVYKHVLYSAEKNLFTFLLLHFF